MRNTMYVAKLAAAVALATVTMNASAVEWHGYARSGIGVSDNGDQQCTGFDKRQVGRLGNECETYAELGLVEEIFNRDGKSMKIETMLAYSSNQDNDYESLASDGDIALRQMNVQAKGFLNFAPEATLWAGKRYYQRHDIHHLDFFYWDVSGPGAGIEGIDAGAGKLSVAWVRADRAGNGVFDNFPAVEGDTDVNVNILDVRYAGISLGSSTLEAGIDYALPNLTDAQKDANFTDESGILLTAELSTPILSGVNKFVLQYGTEGYGDAMRYQGGGNYYALESTATPLSGETSNSVSPDGYRIIDWGVIKATSNIEIGYAAWYASYNRDDFANAHNAYSLSARPVYKWNDYMRSMLEVGYFNADDDAWGTTKQSKITLAQAWSAGPSYWARPEIRAFVSMMDEDEGNTTRFRGEDSVVNVGVQAEAWW